MCPVRSVTYVSGRSHSFLSSYAKSVDYSDGVLRLRLESPTLPRRLTRSNTVVNTVQGVAVFPEAVVVTQMQSGIGCSRAAVDLAGDDAQSAWATDGVSRPGTMLLTITYSTGMKTRFSVVAAIIPPKTVVPTEMRPARPAPCASTNGTTPRINAREVLSPRLRVPGRLRPQAANVAPGRKQSDPGPSPGTLRGRDRSPE
jgi:hypothetical protein